MATEPPPEVQATIEAGIAARGWIVNAYAQFENLLSDFARRACALPEYADIEVPYRTDSRIKSTRELLSREGPLAEFTEPIGDLIDRFEEFEEERLMLVHAYTVVHFDKKLEVTFTFELYRKAAGGQVEKWTSTCDLAHLQALAAHYKAFGNEALGRFRVLHEVMGWA